MTNDGWEIEPPGRYIRDQIVQVLNELAEAAKLTQADLEYYAEQICDCAEIGWSEARPENANISKRGSEQELEAIKSFCLKGIEIFSELHRPARRALSAWEVQAEEMQKYFEKLGQAAHYALHELEDRQGQRGRPEKLDAKYVSEEAAWVFKEITDRRPTVSKDPISNIVSGPWVNFLSRIFEVLGIEAQADYWADKTAREKNRSKESD